MNTKTNGIVIICFNANDAAKVKSELKLFSSPNPWINKSHLQYAKNGVELGIWKQDYDPVVPTNFPNPVFIQGKNETAHELVLRIIAHKAPVKNRHQKAARELMELFPDFNYEEFDTPLDYWTRIVRKNYKAPFDLDDIEKGYEFLFGEWLDERIIESYTKQFPFLKLYGWRDYWDKNVPKVNIYISTIHSHEHPQSEGVSTGVKLGYPFSADDMVRLKELNAEAKEYVDNQRENFFCTGCHKTKPRREYGDYLFHVVKCNDCATPEFRRAARSETYN